MDGVCGRALPQTSMCRSTVGAGGWGGRGCRSDQRCQALTGSQFETYTLRETETVLAILYINQHCCIYQWFPIWGLGHPKWSQDKSEGSEYDK